MSAKPDQLKPKHRMNYLIGSSLRDVDPILYRILHVAANVDFGAIHDSIPLPEFDSIESIYEYITKVFQYVLPHPTLRRHDTKLVVDTNIPSTDMYKFETLERIFTWIADEFDASSQFYLFVKMTVNEGIIYFVFDTVSTKGLEYEKNEERNELLREQFNKLRI